MKEQIIVSFTSYKHRLLNIPTVLDTIYAQTLPPDLVVLNLAHDEVLPNKVNEYIEQHGVEINRVEDTKVYKKIIPTLEKYPNDCIISIDDDWLYPEGMIADFVETHKRYPNNPICGTNHICEQMMTPYHNGCASMVKLDYFEGLLNNIDEDLMKNCPSSDYVYTYFANKAGHPYVRTKSVYHSDTMKTYNEGVSYTEDGFHGTSGNRTYNYLINRFGPIESNFFLGYIDDENIANVIHDIYCTQRELFQKVIESNTYKYTHKLQKFIIKIKKTFNY